MIGKRRLSGGLDGGEGRRRGGNGLDGRWALVDFEMGVGVRLNVCRELKCRLGRK